MIKLEMKSCNIILTEKQQKHHYHQVKMRKMSNLQVKKYCCLIKV